MEELEVPCPQAKGKKNDVIHFLANYFPFSTPYVTSEIEYVHVRS
jgi:hypothetical protein